MASRCDTCSHMRAIRAALKPCQACDCGSHHGASHVEATDYTLPSVKPHTAEPEPITATVTHLSEDDEQTLCRAMASLFALKPEDLLLLQHVMTGGNMASFGEKLTRFADSIRRRSRGSERTRSATTRQRDSIIAEMPELRPLFDAMAWSRVRPL